MWSRRNILSALIPAAIGRRKRKRRARPAIRKPAAGRMLPMDYKTMLPTFTDKELDQFLAFQLLSAMPIEAVEAEARRRGIR